MLSVYTRHSTDCPKNDNINWKRCRCPKWINGTVDGRFIRKTAKTRSWEKAEELLRAWEEAASPKKMEPITIEEAVEAYLADAKARELREATLYKLEIIFRRQFLAWAKDNGVRFLKEIDLSLLRDYRATWRDAALAKKKKQERIIGFFWFCLRAGWLTSNPTQGLGKIAVDSTPTDYFPRDEFEKIVVFPAEIFSQIKQFLEDQGGTLEGTIHQFGWALRADASLEDHHSAPTRRTALQAIMGGTFFRRVRGTGASLWTACLTSLRGADENPSMQSIR